VQELVAERVRIRKMCAGLPDEGLILVGRIIVLLVTVTVTGCYSTARPSGQRHGGVSFRISVERKLVIVFAFNGPFFVVFHGGTIADA
jgi:hypothetical protein